MKLSSTTNRGPAGPGPGPISPNMAANRRSNSAPNSGPDRRVSGPINSLKNGGPPSRPVSASSSESKSRPDSTSKRAPGSDSKSVSSSAKAPRFFEDEPVENHQVVSAVC
jgi:hypothetical protein